MSRSMIRAQTATLDPVTAQPLTGHRRLRALIADVLFTPLGSRLCRRDYGSDLPELLDQPLNDVTIQQIHAATAGTIAAHVTDFQLQSVSLDVDPANPGQATLTLEGAPTNSAPITLTIPLQSTAGASL